MALRWEQSRGRRQTALGELKLARKASLPNETHRVAVSRPTRARARPAGRCRRSRGSRRHSTLGEGAGVGDALCEEFLSPYADLTPLQRLCVIRAVRFDALAAPWAFAAAELGRAEEDSASKQLLPGRI